VGLTHLLFLVGGMCDHLKWWGGVIAIM